MNKLFEAIGAYGVQCSETKELAPPGYLLEALKEHDAKVLESAARCCEKIAYERFAEYGTTEWDTGAGYYTGLDSEERDTRDEEDNSCADAIRRMAESLRTNQS